MGSFTIVVDNAPLAQIPDEAALDLFGEDLLFTDDLQITASGDYALVSGMACLKQALYNRLITAPGEYAVNPEYGVGLRTWVKKRLTQADQDDLRQLIITQLAKEDRIEKVEDVTVERVDQDNSTGIKILVRVRAIGREQTFSFPTFTE